MAENVLSAGMGCNEAVSFGAAEGFHNAGHNRIFQGPSGAVFFLAFFFYILSLRVFGFWQRLIKGKGKAGRHN